MSRGPRELSGQTVIETSYSTTPAGLDALFNKEADKVEQTIVLSSLLAMKRSALHKHLQLDAFFGAPYYLLLGPKYYNIRSQSTAGKGRVGVPIKQRDANRFTNNGFPSMVTAHIHQTGEMVARIDACLGWLFESRMDIGTHSALVKTAVGFENLLVFTAGEPLAQNISERLAFILGATADERAAISRFAKTFYDKRSRVVHGSRLRPVSIKDDILEAADRFLLLAAATVAQNLGMWDTPDKLRTWCETQRWSAAAAPPVWPFSRVAISRALRLVS